VGGRERVLIVSDLHLGFEFELAGLGINLPSQSRKLMDSLLLLLEKAKPRRLIILGDFKHGIPQVSPQEWRDIPEFLEGVKRKVPRLQLIVGNHDVGIEPFLGSGVELVSSRGLILREKQKIGLFHGHAWPSPKLFEAEYWVIGHNHPAVQFRGLFGFRTLKPAWIKVPINRRKLVKSFLHHRNIEVGEKGNPERVFRDKFGVQAHCTKLIVMPAFNDLLGGLAVNAVDPQELIGPIMRSEGVLVPKAEVFLTDGTFLGALKSLREYA
jgi:hypothetical protein